MASQSSSSQSSPKRTQTQKKQQDSSELERLKSRYEESKEYFKQNVDDFRYYQRFLLVSNFDEDEKAAMESLNRVPLEFNFLEPVVQQQLGQLYENTPEIIAKTKSIKTFQLPPDGNNSSSEATTITQQDLLTGILRDIMLNSDKESDWRKRLLRDAVIGGFGVAFVNTEYTDDDSFQQRVVIDHVEDPTAVFFDPLAKKKNKSDSRFVLHAVPVAKTQFVTDNAEYLASHPDPSIDKPQVGKAPYGYSKGDEDYIMCFYYFERVVDKLITIHYLPNGQIVTSKEYGEIKARIEAAREQGMVNVVPKIVKSRKIKKYRIDQYIFYKNGILDYRKTKYKHIPYVYADGNSVNITKDDKNSHAVSNTQTIRPFFYNAIDAQKFKNIAGSLLAYEMTTLSGWKIKVAEESISRNPAFAKSLIEPQKATALIYRATDDDGAPIPAQPPTEVSNPGPPPVLENSFFNMDKSMQNQLGVYNASIGDTDARTSGVAIDKATMNASPALSEYVQNHIDALRQISNIIVDLLPMVYMDERQVQVQLEDGERRLVTINQKVKGEDGVRVINPQSPNLLCENNKIDVEIKPGINIDSQRQQSMATMMQLMQALPGFAQFVEQFGMRPILQNLKINGSDQLVVLWEEWMSQQQKQSQNNPAAQAQQQQMQMEQADLQIKQVELQLKHEQLQLDKARLAVQAKNNQSQNGINAFKAQTQHVDNQVDLSLRAMNQHHQHEMDVFKT